MNGVRINKMKRTNIKVLMQNKIKKVNVNVRSATKDPSVNIWTLDAKVCEARSKRMKGVYNSNNRVGTHHSEETKRKMSEARKRYYENKKNVKT